jgi:hypothetical protein
MLVQRVPYESVFSHFFHCRAGKLYSQNYESIFSNKKTKKDERGSSGSAETNNVVKPENPK